MFFCLSVLVACRITRSCWWILMKFGEFVDYDRKKSWLDICMWFGTYYGYQSVVNAAATPRLLCTSAAVLVQRSLARVHLLLHTAGFIVAWQRYAFHRVPSNCCLFWRLYAASGKTYWRTRHIISTSGNFLHRTRPIVRGTSFLTLKNSRKSPTLTSVGRKLSTLCSRTSKSEVVGSGIFKAFLLFWHVRVARQFPALASRTKKYQSFINFGLLKYQ